MTDPVEFTVYPDECDSFGHLNQASYMALFERARWEVLARGPGMNAFPKAGVWPAVRRAVLEFNAGTWPGETLIFTLEVLHRGRTSFTLKQEATRKRDQRLVASAEIVFVCIDDEEHPVPVPDSILAALGMEPQRVLIRDGISLALEDLGRGDPPLLLIHGFPLDREVWTPQLRALDGHRLIAPDLRGFGLSSVPQGPLMISDYADDLIALLDHLAIQQAVICGVSMGGYVALDLVRRFRERIAGLVLVDSRARADGPAEREARDAMITLAQQQGAMGVAEQLAARLFAPGADPALQEPVLLRMQRTPVAGITAALAAMRDRPDSTDLLATLGDLPVLVVIGTEDQIIPAAQGRALAAAIPGARLVEIPGAGHLPSLERADQLNLALEQFLRSLPS